MASEHWRLGAKYVLAEQIIDQPIESVTASGKGVTGALGTWDQPAATDELGE
jgi:hypothetical protein